MSAIQHIPSPPADFVLPFDLPAAGVRGRLVRLADAAARALDHHGLPESAGRLGGEMLALSALLGSLLKLDGRLTIQAQGPGPISLVVADYYGADAEKIRGVRALARIDRERLELLGKHPDFPALIGAGALAITIRPRIEARDYQGVVELSGEGLAASAENYFMQSEQLETFVHLTAAQSQRSGEAAPSWRAAGLLLQVTPEGARGPDDWARLKMLAATITDLELVDCDLAAETLLWRLFNQEEVRLQPAQQVIFRCDCSLDSIAAVLRSYSEEERAGLADEDGVIRAKCEFCGTMHEIAV